MSSVESDLAKQQKMWSGAKARSGLGKLPAGTYEARIVSVVIKRAKSGKKGLAAVWQLKVTGGKVKGATCFKRSNLGTKENMEFLKGELKVLDLEIPEDLTELPDVLNKAKGMLVEIRVVEKGEFSNIYFNEALGVEDSEEEEESEDEESEDEESEEEESSDEDENEEDEKPRKKGKKSKDEDEDEEESEEKDEDEEKSEESEDEEEEKPRKKGKKSKDEDEEESEDEDEEVTAEDEEESEEKPRKKKKGKK
jgi:hypothetical protein